MSRRRNWIHSSDKRHPLAFRMKIFLLLAAFALLAILTMVYQSQGLGQVQLVSSGTSDRGVVEIGVRGPFTLKFAEAMLRESVESRLSLDPPVPGKFTWEESQDQIISFWPAHILQPGQHFTVRLAAGARSTNQHASRWEQTWQTEVRQPGLLFLSPSAAPELRLVSSSGEERTQLTHTGGKIYDYGVSFDGTHIAYAAKNEQQGYDLWEMGRQGEGARMILPCGADWCTTPSYAPDGNTLVYSRRKASGLPGRQPEIPHLWTINRSSQASTTKELFADPHISGTQTYWSPDGQDLAFYDEGSGGVRIYHSKTQSSSLFPAAEGTGIEWLPYGKALLYLEAGTNGEQPYNWVTRLDTSTWDRDKLFEEAAGIADYSVPAVSTDGKWMVAGQRLPGGSLTRQLWLAGAGAGGDKERQAITDDVMYNHGGYQWEPGGSRLVFQRLGYGSSDSMPQVVVWNRLDGEALLLSEDGFQPYWIP